MNSEATAKEAVLDKRYNIAKREAEQKAKQKDIEQTQENQYMIKKADAKLKSAKMEAEAIKIKAQAEADTQRCKFEAQAKISRNQLTLKLRKSSVRPLSI